MERNNIGDAIDGTLVEIGPILSEEVTFEQRCDCSEGANSESWKKNIPRGGDGRSKSLRWELRGMSVSSKDAWWQEGSEQMVGEKMPEGGGGWVPWGPAIFGFRGNVTGESQEGFKQGSDATPIPQTWVRETRDSTLSPVRPVHPCAPFCAYSVGK